MAEAVAELGWRYLVLTAVDRDDLVDGGASIFAATVRMIHRLSPEAKVECLTGDFAGDMSALDIVLEARPEVLAHNLETVRRFSRMCVISAPTLSSRLRCFSMRSRADW